MTSLGIKTISDLEDAASNGKIRNIPGFFQRKKEVILKKIEFFKKVMIENCLKSSL